MKSKQRKGKKARKFSQKSLEARVANRAIKRWNGAQKILTFMKRATPVEDTKVEKMGGLFHVKKRGTLHTPIDDSARGMFILQQTKGI